DNPEDTRALLRLGDLLVRTGKPDEAAGPYWRAADLYERDGFFLKAAAVCKQIYLLGSGQHLAVRTALTRLAEVLGLPLEVLLPKAARGNG
ncbi:MAG: hypothetical protein IT371_30230, partial [Deltaproteobacteria bacterium]|nr:hypothetical protein [Deltaproteobacteria bacterium]